MKHWFTFSVFDDGSFLSAHFLLGHPQCYQKYNEQEPSTTTPTALLLWDWSYAKWVWKTNH